MSFRKTHFVVTSVLLVLLSLMSVTSVPSSVSQTVAVTRGVPVPSSGVYTDSLDTVTYYDGTNTTAIGWGGGTLLNARATGLVTALDSYNTGETVRSVEIQGRKLYTTLFKTTTGVNALRVFNISDPTNMQWLDGQHPATHLIAGEVDGDLMFVGQSDAGSWWRIYNVSDPTNIPASIFAQDMVSGSITDFEIQGRFLYMSVFHRSGTDFHIFDITDPTSPFWTYSQGWSDILGIDVSGHVLAGCNGINGLNVRNVSNPYAPYGLDWVDTPGNSTDVIIDGDICYVADGPSGVQVVDISDLSDISIIGSYDTPGNAVDVELQGDTLVVADLGGGVHFLDVSDPTSPWLVTSLGLTPAYDIAIQDGLLAIAAGDTIYLYEIGTLTNPALFSTYNDYDALDVDVQGDVAYIAAGIDGLVVLNVSDPAAPVLLDSIWVGLSRDYTTVDVQGTYAFVTNWGSSYKGLLCFDVSDPSNVVFRDHETFTYPYDVAVAGDVAYVADGIWGLYLVNVSDPWNIGIFNAIDVVENCSAVDVQGHFVYTVGNGTTYGAYGLFGYNLNNLPIIRDTDFVAFTDPEDVAVCGDFAAIGNGGWGINIADITDPWSMSNIGWVTFPGDFYCYAVEMFGNYIFAAERGVGIHFVNATEFPSFQHISTYSTGNPDCRSMTLDGDFLYVACGDRLLIFRVFNSFADTWETALYAQSLEVDSTDRTLENATLSLSTSLPPGSSIDFQLSADGGAHWESVISGSPHTFVNQGHKLLWKASLASLYNDRTPRLYDVTLNYDYNDLPTAPTLVDPGTTDNDGAFTVSWSASTDDGTVASYQLLMSNTSGFTTILQSWTPTTTSQAVFALVDDTYYFRVRALDDDGEYGAWSNIENLEVLITIAPLNPLLIGAIIAVIIIVIILIVYFLYYRKRK